MGVGFGVRLTVGVEAGLGVRVGIGLGGGDLQRRRVRACATSPVMRATDTERGTGEMGIAIWMFSAAVRVRLHGTKYSSQHLVSRNDCRAVPAGRSSLRYLVRGGEEARGVRVCVYVRGWVGAALLPIYPGVPGVRPWLYIQAALPREEAGALVAREDRVGFGVHQAGDQEGAVATAERDGGHVAEASLAPRALRGTGCSSRRP